MNEKVNLSELDREGHYQRPARSTLAQKIRTVCGETPRPEQMMEGDADDFLLRRLWSRQDCRS